MIISFTNVIGAIRSLGEAAAQVITTNLKMWLGFETSETLGREEVDNGDFATPQSDWTFANGWGLSNNTAIYNGTGAQYAKLVQPLTTVAGRTYQVTFTLNELSGSNVKIGLATSANAFLTGATNFTALGTHTITMTATASDNRIVLQVNSATMTCTISNVSVKKLTQITPDKSGNNNVGELFTGKALDFDGAGDYLDVSGFSMSGNNATFAFWAYIRDNARADYFFDFHSSTTRFVFGFGQASQKLAVYSGGWQDFGDPPQDQWVRIVLTINGTTAKCFVDGVQLGTDKTISTYDFSSPTTIHIGARYTPETIPKWYDGVLSDFQVYNSVWLTDDIAYDYANPNKLAIDNPNTSLSVTNLKGYWALSEGDGLVAYDSGTNLEEEEVINGDFSDGTNDWSFGTGWSIVDDKASLAQVSGSVSDLLYQDITSLVNGKTYSISFDLEISSSATFIGVSSTGAFGNLDLTIRGFSTSGTKTFDATYDSSHASGIKELRFVGTQGAAFTVDNISVREVTASDHGGILIGATYVDAQPRIPQLGMMNWSKGSNLLTYSEDFSQSVWTKNNLTQTYGFTSPTGLLNATKLIRTSSNSYIDFTINITTVQYNTASIYVKGVSSTIGEDVRLYVYNGTGVSSEAFTLTGDWQRITHTNSSAPGQSYMKIKLDIPNVTNGEVLVWAAQLEQSSSASAYRLTDGGATSNSTVIPNPTIPTQDIFGNAVRDRLNSFNLDGSGYAEVADDDSLNMSSGFSTSFWVKLDEGSTTTDYDFLVCKGRGVGGTNTAYGFGTTYYDNTIIATINTSVSKYQAISPSQTSTGQWVFVCVTYEPNTLLGLKLYLDDNSPNSITVSGTVDESHNLNVGRDSSFVTTRQSRNIISDVLFYDSVLTSDEVENNYNAGLSAHRN